VAAVTPSAEDGWYEARLIPVAGIRGQEEQEKRATSALLAVMRAVPEFGRALLADLGTPRGQIRTYAEVQLRAGDGKLSIPDGAIVVERGARRWRALVEVKTGSAVLRSEQVSRYLDMARDHGFDALVTISNEITPSPEHLPVAVDRRKTRRVAAYHLSWWRIMTEAILQHRHRGIDDPDQAWILGELIAYLDHEKSGASGFQDMGQSWVKVRDGARQGTLRAGDAVVGEVADRWMQFMDYLALGLSQDLGTDVAPLRPRRQSMTERHASLVDMLASEGCLRGGARVPNAIAPVEIRADLRARQVTTSVTFDAPREGRPSARINWLLRQLRDAPGSLRIEVAFANTRETTSLLLGEAREYPQRLLASDPRREPRVMTVALTRPMGQKGGKIRGSFVGDLRHQLIEFYGEIVQRLKPWQAKAPRLPTPPDDVEISPQPDAPSFAATAQDEEAGRELGEATTPAEGRG
jgi:hypothetical protein